MAHLGTVLIYCEHASATPPASVSLPADLARAVEQGARVGFDAAACACLARFLRASFVPQNAPELEELLTSQDDVHPRALRVSAAQLEPGARLPSVLVEAEFELSFTRALDDDALLEWQEDHDVWLRTDCASFWWDLGDPSWDGVLDDQGGGADLLTPTREA